MKILVTGASGLLGHKIVQIALKKGHEVYAIYNEHKVDIGISIQLDITNRDKLFEKIFQLKPDTIIHAAAYTDVEGSEINKELAWKINAEATKNIAKASANIDSHMIYVSTDYVFDGEKGLYSEEDAPNPINYYGYTKLKGEEFTKESNTKYCIARASVIYGWAYTHKQNFATWIINNLKQGKEIKIITDQYVSPTLNTNLAEMLLEIAEREITGILHTAGATRTSRYNFAKKLAEIFDLNPDLIKQAKINEMSWKAKRPKDSSLDIKKALKILNQKPLELEHALKKMKEETNHTFVLT
ncbi:MAG: dTDP-4-dehydrorhamnose reductase [Thermoprotei archaeon]